MSWLTYPIAGYLDLSHKHSATLQLFVEQCS